MKTKKIRVSIWDRIATLFVGEKKVIPHSTRAISQKTEPAQEKKTVDVEPQIQGYDAYAEEQEILEDEIEPRNWWDRIKDWFSGAVEVEPWPDRLKKQIDDDVKRKENQINRADNLKKWWQNWLEEKSAEEESRFQRRMLRDKNRLYRKAVRESREEEQTTDTMLRYILGHSYASKVTGVVMQMAGAALMELQSNPRLVWYIKKNNPGYDDPLTEYSKAIASLTEAAQTLDTVETIILNERHKMNLEDEEYKKLNRGFDPQ